MLTELLRRVEGPAVALAWDAVKHERFEVLANVDDEVYALRPTSAGRESTRAMGSRLLKTWRHIRPQDSARLLLAGRSQMTLPVAFGAVASASGISVRATLEGFIYVCELSRIRHNATRLALAAGRTAPRFATGSMLGSRESNFRGWGACEGTGARWTKRGGGVGVRCKGESVVWGDSHH